MFGMFLFRKLAIFLGTAFYFCTGKEISLDSLAGKKFYFWNRHLHFEIQHHFHLHIQKKRLLSMTDSHKLVARKLITYQSGYPQTTDLEVLEALEVGNIITLSYEQIKAGHCHNRRSNKNWVIKFNSMQKASYFRQNQKFQP